MADVGGEQPLALQRLAQLAEGAVERSRQMAHLVIHILQRQRRCQRMQLVAVAYLIGQPADRGHHLVRHQPAEQPGAQHAQQEAGEHCLEQGVLALLELVLVFHQHVALAVQIAYVDVVGLVAADHLGEALGQRGEAFGQRIVRQRGAEEACLGVEARWTSAGQVLVQHDIQLATQLLGHQL